jgi:hypothetical protein
MKKFIFMISVMDREVYTGEWEAETIEKAEEEIKEIVALDIVYKEVKNVA